MTQQYQHAENESGDLLHEPRFNKLLNSKEGPSNLDDIQYLLTGYEAGHRCHEIYSMLLSVLHKEQFCYTVMHNEKTFASIINDWENEEKGNTGRHDHIETAAENYRSMLKFQVLYAKK